MLDERKIIKTVIIFQKIYFVFICIGSFLVIYIATGVSSYYNRTDALDVLPWMLVHLTIYLGLRMRKEWLIHLILITSACQILWHAFSMLHAAEDMSMLICKLLGFIGLFFYSYQVCFFARPEVKVAFNERGSTLF